MKVEEFLRFCTGSSVFIIFKGLLGYNVVPLLIHVPVRLSYHAPILVIWILAWNSFLPTIMVGKWMVFELYIVFLVDQANLLLLIINVMAMN